MKSKILVIEDEQAVRNNILTLLNEEGYSVLTAKNGREGILTAINEKPDLIICDIMMPGIDGYGVLDELSKNQAASTIPFIFLTAKVERDDIRRGMRLGADDYIFKPFSAEDLILSIKTRLNRVKTLKGEFAETDGEPNSNKYSADDRIFISVAGKPALIKIREIVFISAENQYSSVKLENEKNYLLRKSITAWQEALPEKMFLKINRSTLINLDYIVKIEKSYNSSFIVYLKNIHSPFIISKRYSSLLRKEGI